MKSKTLLMMIQLMVVILCFSSCSTNSNNDKSSSISALESGHWKKVKNKPPTYFPREISKDHPTSVRDGYWIERGDTKGTRFFVPLRNTKLSSDDLIAEAQSAMSPQAKEELSQRQKHVQTVDAIDGSAKFTLNVLGAIATALGGR